jgi:pimeloyl-ACP methyl ester carboxylesterase
LLDKGWIYVATDYAGQGASGPNPYLVGEGEARSALDSVRALRQMADVHAGDDVVVWGHSQGGHAALWTGILAPTYAPDVNIRGVAAVAPASDLRPLLDAIHGTPVGRIMSSFVLHSYADAYPDVRPDDYLSAFRKWVATDVASRCLAGPGTLFSLFEVLVLRDGIFAVTPTSGPLGERLRQNTPDRLLPQPVLIAQGLADDLVLPKIQSRFARRRCDFGQSLDYRTYDGRDHLSVIAPDSPLTGDLVRWTQDRFDRVPVPEACSGDLRR